MLEKCKCKGTYSSVINGVLRCKDCLLPIEIVKEEKFSEKQNEVFSGIFGELQNRNCSFRSKAVAMMSLDDDNFLKVYEDPNNIVEGSEDEIKLVGQRYKSLKS